MPRYVAFLRGVSPMNAKMPEVKRAFECAGFTNVKTVLSSGNVVFDSRTKSDAALARQAEKAMEQELERTFLTIVRAVNALNALLESQPHDAFRLPARSKRIVTFLRKPLSAELKLPIKRDDASILAIHGCDVISAYVPRDNDPAFMRLIEKTFGTELTTRTLDTVRKCTAA